MAQSASDGETAAKRLKASNDDAAGDRLSALPDDVLALILLSVDTPDAARASVLSRRWRHVWTLLPSLTFFFAHDSQSQHCIRRALSASEVPLRSLLVAVPDPSPEFLAAWLPFAARRVSGKLLLVNFVPGRRDADDASAEADRRGTFALPCFEKATSICINVGFIGLSVPPAGVFARLTDLSLSSVRFHGPGDLGDVVSSPRCPCLENLTLRDVLGLDRITINSESLQQLELKNLRDVQQITVVALALKDLTMLHCYIDYQNQPVVNISAPQLTSLKWLDAYDPSSVHLGCMKQLQTMCTYFFVYGLEEFTHNRACLMLLPQFKAIEYLVLSLSYLPVVDNLQCLMEDITVLPKVESLQLNVMAKWHAFGACSFHILRICSGINQLILVLSSPFELEEPSACSTNCICDEPVNWKIEEISLNHLKELDIIGFRGSEHEVAFVKRLLNWVPVLKTMTLTFNRSVTENKAKEVYQMFRGFRMPGVWMEFYIYRKFRKVLYTPED